MPIEYIKCSVCSKGTPIIKCGEKEKTKTKASSKREQEYVCPKCKRNLYGKGTV